ncbi:MAG: TRAP transporter substrate-binding protein DctP [Croceibacterium sp.]
MRIAAIVLALLALGGCSRAADPGVTELVYASPYGPSHPFSRADITWMKFVEQRSGGTLKIRPNWSGGLLSADMSLEELRHGVADIGLVTPIYVRGGTHLIRIQSGFYSGATTPQSQVALYRCIAAASPQVGRELAGLKVLAVQGGTLPGIVTRDRPIRTLEDLRGLRIRAPTELLSVLEKLGAEPVNMPMGEVYSAMAKGVIDGVVAPADTFRSLHFAEVAKYFNTIEIPRGAYPARAIGERRWRQLSPQQQAVLEEGIAVWEAALAQEVQAAWQQGYDEAVARKVEIAPIDPAQQRRFDALYLAEAQQNAAALGRFGIDGTAAFNAARASIREGNRVLCAL